MQILDRRISPSEKPYVIAEVSANHGGDLNRALDMVAAAAEAGASAVKFQTYTADTITIRCDRPEFRIENPDSLWSGRTLHDLYDEAHMPWEWQARWRWRAQERLDIVRRLRITQTVASAIRAGVCSAGRTRRPRVVGGQNGTKIYRDDHAL